MEIKTEDQDDSDKVVVAAAAVALRDQRGDGPCMFVDFLLCKAKYNRVHLILVYRREKRTFIRPMGFDTAKRCGEGGQEL